MKKLSTLSNFEYCTQFGKIGNERVPCEILFDMEKIAKKHDELPELFVETNVSGKGVVKIGIASNDKESKRIAFNSLYFSDQELLELSRSFDFRLIDNPYHDRKLQATLSFIHKDYKNVNIRVKKCKESFFLLIFSSRRSVPARSMSEDFYGNDIYYIHGIWEVELSEDLIKKIGI